MDLEEKLYGMVDDYFVVQDEEEIDPDPFDHGSILLTAPECASCTIVYIVNGAGPTAIVTLRDGRSEIGWFLDDARLGTAAAGLA